jgi:ABC-type uncharacterized transport system fused permease/ATPase subunit
MVVEGQRSRADSRKPRRQLRCEPGNKWFFDALERKDGSTMTAAILAIIALVVVGPACAVAMIRCRMTLQVKWRQWLTGELLDRWLSEQRYYRLAVTDEEQINPEYRIAEDLRLASEPVVEFVIGFINALLAAVTSLASCSGSAARSPFRLVARAYGFPATSRSRR